jgi:predicted adenylyl cyclase CyaB
MAVEIEAKMKVDSLEAIQERLTKLGAEPKGEAIEVNTFFDTDDRSLLAADKGLRLRTATPLPEGKPKYTMTFKGPRQHGPLKSREEKELGVDSAKNATALLEILGFHHILSFEKKRQSWELGDCKVELDELPYLGVFVEIEGPKEDSVMKIRQSLELADEPIIKASYVALLMTHLQESGSASRVVTFPK